MLYRVTALCFTEQSQRDCVSPFFEIAFVLVRFNHVARSIVNADHGIM
jgi:hypothetical protein